MRGADAYRKNFHARVRRFLGFVYRVATKFLAVCENNEGAISHRAFPKCLCRQCDRFADVGAAFWNCFRIQVVDRFNRSIVIDRQRCLQKGATGEGDEADAIAPQICDQILCCQFDALKSVRRYIIR